MKKLILFLASMFLASSALADPRIYNFTYDKDRVFPIYTMLGEAFILQFEDGEHLKDESAAFGLGDSKAWSVAVRGNGILMKPVDYSPNTNVLVVTNKRTYAFEILSATKDHRPTYVVRFRYPESEAALRKQQAIKAAADIKANDALKREIYLRTEVTPIFNPKYSWIGSNSKTTSLSVSLLKPTAAWDDGRFTHLQYDSAVSMPNFYKVNPDGTESIINTNIDPKEKNTVILQEVVRMIRVRLGKEVIEIVNDDYKVPSFNSAGTGDFDSVRLLRN